MADEVLLSGVSLKKVFYFAKIPKVENETVIREYCKIVLIQPALVFCGLFIRSFAVQKYTIKFSIRVFMREFGIKMV
jgi:hypothetical protein